MYRSIAHFQRDLDNGETFQIDLRRDEDDDSQYRIAIQRKNPEGQVAGGACLIDHSHDRLPEILRDAADWFETRLAAEASPE